MYDKLEEAKEYAKIESLKNSGKKFFVSGNSYGNWFMVDKNAGFDNEEIGYYIVCYFLNGEETEIQW